MGALPEVYAATSPDVRGGDYIGPDGFMGQKGFPQKVGSNSRSYDQAVAARLWAVSEELTGVSTVGLITGTWRLNVSLHADAARAIIKEGLRKSEVSMSDGTGCWPKRSRRKC